MADQYFKAGSAKFGVGQCVRHQLFDYRGVIYDVDATFQGGDEWYRRMARSKPPKDQPWYHVLVDGESHTTYVAERNLRAEDAPAPISHPMVESLFDGFVDGAYVRRGRRN